MSIDYDKLGLQNRIVSYYLSKNKSKEPGDYNITNNGNMNGWGLFSGQEFIAPNDEIIDKHFSRDWATEALAMNGKNVRGNTIKLLENQVNIFKAQLGRQGGGRRKRRGTKRRRVSSKKKRSTRRKR